MSGCGLWSPELDPRTRQKQQESWWSYPNLCHTSRSKDSILQRCPVRARGLACATISFSCTTRLVGCGRGGLPFLSSPPRLLMQTLGSAQMSPSLRQLPLLSILTVLLSCSLQLSRFSNQYKLCNSPICPAQGSKGVIVRDWATRCQLWSRNLSILARVRFWGYHHQFRALGGAFMGLAVWK